MERERGALNAKSIMGLYIFYLVSTMHPFPDQHHQGEYDQNLGRRARNEVDGTFVPRCYDFTIINSRSDSIYLCSRFAVLQQKRACFYRRLDASYLPHAYRYRASYIVFFSSYLTTSPHAYSTMLHWDLIRRYRFT